jgi:hypothetical protein
MEMYFVTPHGTYQIEYNSAEQTLEEICLSNRIPIQSTTFYGTTTQGHHSIIVGQYKKVGALKNLYQCIYIRPDRNIDYQAICQKKIQSKQSPLGVAEYSFPSPDAKELYHIEFSEQECKNYVSIAVDAFFKTEVNISSSSKIVIGVSGGGDSNTLIEAFLASGKIQANQIIAVMMLGIPDWDCGRKRAESICRAHGVELRFVEPEMVNRLLGRKTSNDWVEDFETIFPDADLEVLGTLAIRLSLIFVAKSEEAQAIVTGLNLEDLLAECFFTTMQGQLPSPFPVRLIDGIPLWYPLYKIPKKILDGCHPKFSLANYADRYPSKMLNRANFYYLSQMLHAHLPGSEFDLLNGFKALSQLNTDYSCYDETLGFSVSATLPQDLKNKWLIFTQM